MSAQAVLVLVASMALAVAGCTRKAVDAPKGKAATAAPKVDTAGDSAAAEKGWALGIARDPTPIGDLAKFEGWRSYFGGQPSEALDKFLADGMPAEPAARIGVARAALDLARAHQDVQQLVVALTPQVLAALATRPDIDQAKPWIALIEARHAAATGKPTAAALAKITAPDGAGLWVPLLAAGAAGPGPDLLAGRASGVDAPLPAGASDAFEERLNIASLVAAGRYKEARKRYARIPPKKPDFRIAVGEGAVTLWDPMSLTGGAHVLAALAADAVKDLPGWPQLLAAEAQMILGDPVAAAKLAGAVASGPPTDAPSFAQLTLTDAHGADDLKYSALALQAKALRRSGDVAGADAAAGKIPSDTIARRVFRLDAGLKDAGEAFPQDRDVLVKVLLDKFAAMGEVEGADDFAKLSLADRYVDAVQRRYGLALYAADKKALAVKAFESAEDKSARLEPSNRNLVSAMTSAARMNAGIGRPRVALKYLSRLDAHVPAVAAPAELLRDLLSLRAMENSGGATAGQ